MALNGLTIEDRSAPQFTSGTRIGQKNANMSIFFWSEIFAIAPVFAHAPYFSTSGKPGRKKARYIAGLSGHFFGRF